ncbi:aminopeptidase P family protein [Alicyclobacillus sp. SP_1]|uniref:aminopeptidase P family protein n=1 Tax=Alicyclobacillus sp. SP_1 TaxID=2942475 RepID=UPI002158112A|nr:aminopeptidase P family protein [Alicyclobacillus sp. SP_1]
MGHCEDRVARRANLADQMVDGSLAIFFAGEAPPKSEDHAYDFSVNRNFFYLTGIDRESACLVMSKRNGQVSEILFIERPNPDMEKWTGRRMTVEEAKVHSGLETVLYTEAFEGWFGRAMSWQNLQTLYLDFDQHSFGQPTLQSAHRFAHQIQQKYPGLRVMNFHYALGQMRLYKSSSEIEETRKAIDITDAGIRNVLAHSKAGMMEYELEAHFNFTLCSRGVREHAFPPIVAGGERATILHYVTNSEATKDGDLVLLDLGAACRYYSADISRTFPVNGKFSALQKQYYQLVLDTEEAVIAAVRPGVTWKELNDIAKSSLAKGMMKLGKIQQESELDRYYYHSVGHPLGLDTHDVGDRDAVLAPGMIVTIEPGIYVAEDSIGIRIEDDILVTETGHENLSRQIPKTIAEIERCMAH